MAPLSAERDLERLFDVSLDLLCIAGFDGYFKRVNPAFERTLGYTIEELLSRPFYDFVHPDEIDATRGAMEALAHGDEVRQFANRYVCRDGSVRWLEWNTHPALEEGLLYAAGRDVTERRLLAEEQGALRRVATCVAQGRSSTEVFRVVTEEIERLMGSDSGGLVRFELDGTASMVANHTRPGTRGFPVGMRIPLEGQTLAGAVWRTGKAARLTYSSDTDSALVEQARALGIRCAVGAPIFVDGRAWGMIAAAWISSPPAVQDLEGRLMQFGEIVGTAIANAHSRAELIASRARVVVTSDETRRRIERDLHDGTQQRLVSLALGLRSAEEKVPPELTELRADLDRIARGLAGAVEELQEISRGIHPAILSRGGLGPALKTLARRAALPVEVDLRVDRKLPERVEVAAYYVVSEAITNAAKHAKATLLEVRLEAEDAVLRLDVRDDGVGGADPIRGSGLVGLRDRVEAVGGAMVLSSGAGQGTSLQVTIPLDGD